MPAQTALLQLRSRGRSVTFPSLDAQGRLWLESRDLEEESQDSLEISVRRQVDDDIPLVLHSQIEIQVTGKSREVLLGRALPDHFVPMSIDAPLPARLEADHRLRVQLRTGRWIVNVMARHEGPATSLALPQADGPWGAEEIWVFAARPHLRLVTIEGATPIDPQQTTLPDPWKRFPSYRMKPGDVMKLVEKRRGDSDPPPDQLALERSWWLDFDGKGYTIQDRVMGRMERGWRLEMPPPARLGHVSVNGQDQFITRLAEDGRSGVELRQGLLDLTAASRLEGGPAAIPAVGWDHDFHQVSGVLNLPPAWRLFHAFGVDDASPTWIASWTLLDLFLVMLIAMSVAKLWGRSWGIVALVCLGLTWTEPWAPKWVWIAVLTGEALVRVIPSGRARSVLSVYRLLAVATLAIFGAVFMVLQVRSAIYPALEGPRGPLEQDQHRFAAGQGEARTAASREVWMEQQVSGAEGRRRDAGLRDEVAAPGRVGEVVGGVVGGVLGGVASKVEGGVESGVISGVVGGVAGGLLSPVEPKVAAALGEHDPSVVVQTGPGLPDWSWNTVLLSWRGPVEHGQRLRLVLIPPAINFALAFLRVGLLCLLAVCVSGFSGSGPGRELLDRLLHWLRAIRSAAALMLLGVALTAAAGPAWADFPSNDLLETLRRRLLEPPECTPDCASIPRLAFEIRPSWIQARLEVHAAAETGVPLPGGAAAWLPERVFLDGAPAPGLSRSPDGRLWIQIPAGIHQVLMEGPLPGRDSVQIPLPLKPQRVESRVQGWRLDGVQEDGLPADSLQLSRLRAGGGAGRGLEPGELPPFVRVQRTLRLGLKWQVDTRVERLTPAGAAIVMQVPLLPGEAVTTPDVRVKDGRALVSLAPGTRQAAWTSRLEYREAVELQAPMEMPWTEVWLVAVAPVWHLEASGIPIVHSAERGVERVREWRPWPGESVKLEVSRPAGQPGETFTIDASALVLTPGLRVTDANLELRLRSSRGGQHVLSLPEGAQLQSVEIDGVDEPIRLEGRDVTLPLSPGSQKLDLHWRQETGVRTFFRAPEIRLGAASVNALTQVMMPADRWTLFLWGPRLGPAVLFWSVLTVALLLSLVLGQIGITPLRWQHWFMLSLGLTQVPVWAPALIAGWILALGWRKERGARVEPPAAFNLCQALLALWSVVALIGLFSSLTHGLLGLPNMQISGNGSSAQVLRWYQDRASEVLPRPWVFSVPLGVYRLAMLAWALWLAQALLRWLQWGWECLIEGGSWRPVKPRIKPPAPEPAA